MYQLFNITKHMQYQAHSASTFSVNSIIAKLKGKLKKTVEDLWCNDDGTSLLHVVQLSQLLTNIKYNLCPI